MSPKCFRGNEATMKTRILLVEDDAKLRRTLAAWITHAGYDVTQAADGETAIRLLTMETFAVVVTDLVMGGLGGLDVLQATSCLHVRPAVILLTGQGTLESAMAALRAGAFDYLLKPCSGSELLLRIAAAVAHVEADRQVRSALEALLGTVPAAALTNGLPASFLGGFFAGPASAPFHAPAIVSPGMQGGGAAVPGTKALSSTAAVWSNGSAVATPPARGSRRAGVDADEQWLRLGDLHVGPSRLQVSFQGQPVALTRIEYALLRHLAERPGQVCRYGELAFASHRLELDDGEARDLLRTHLQNLRSKVCRSYFRIEAGAGCMLAVPTPLPSRRAI
jgi:DNA-binding response OmpR family regulator